MLWQFGVIESIERSARFYLKLVEILFLEWEILPLYISVKYINCICHSSFLVIQIYRKTSNKQLSLNVMFTQDVSQNVASFLKIKIGAQGFYSYSC